MSNSLTWAGSLLRRSVQCLGALTALAPMALQAAPLTWSLLHDQSVVSTSSETLSRSLRGLALSGDDQSLYGGFIQKSLGSGVRHFTLSGDPPVGTAAAYFNVTTIGPSGTDHQPKAVATDDRGFVYVGSSKDSTSGDNARVIIKDGSLGAEQKVFVLADITATPSGFTGERVGGLSLRRADDGTLYLYVSREAPYSAYVERYLIGGTDITTATLTLDTTFNGTGRFSLRTVFADASDLRGLEVAEDGTLFVTSSAGDAVYRISDDLTSVTRQTVDNAIDLALFDSRVFVTSYNAAASAIFELSAASTLDLLGSFDAFGDFARPGITGTVAGTGYAGIDIDAQGRIYLADQLYYRDSAESKDRILVSSALELLPTGAVPAPASLGLVGLALVAIAVTRRPTRRPSQSASRSIRSTTSRTSGQPSGPPTQRALRPQGWVRRGTDAGPNTPITGASTAAARCIGPESLAMVTRAPRHTAA